MRARDSLILAGKGAGAGRPWSHRGGELARIWTLSLSIAIHIALIYWVSDWLNVRSLASIETPFVVSLAAPLVEQKPLPPAVEPRAVEEESTPREANRPAEEIPEPVPGVPDALPLEPDPIIDLSLEPPKEEPVLGDTTEIEPAPVEFIRSDVVGDLTTSLLEQSKPLPAIPISDPGRASQKPDTDRARSKTGADAGIEGPLGKRGLLSWEQPVYPEQMQTAGFENELRFRFYVSPAGNVIRIDTLQKSGQPAWESAARQALSRWRFEPLEVGIDRDEWGEVPIIYDLTSRESQLQ